MVVLRVVRGVRGVEDVETRLVSAVVGPAGGRLPVADLTEVGRVAVRVAAGVRTTTAEVVPHRRTAGLGARTGHTSGGTRPKEQWG